MAGLVGKGDAKAQRTLAAAGSLGRSTAGSAREVAGWLPWSFFAGCKRGGIYHVRGACSPQHHSRLLPPHNVRAPAEGPGPLPLDCSRWQGGYRLAVTAALCTLPVPPSPSLFQLPLPVSRRCLGDGPRRARCLVRFDLGVLQAEAKQHPGTTPFPEASGRMMLPSFFSLFRTK